MWESEPGAPLGLKAPPSGGRGRLYQPPPGDDTRNRQAWPLLPLDFNTYCSAELLVDERSPYQQPIAWLNESGVRSRCRA